jgi:hypothetical protein
MIVHPGHLGFCHQNSGYLQAGNPTSCSEDGLDVAP